MRKLFVLLLLFMLSFTIFTSDKTLANYEERVTERKDYQIQINRQVIPMPQAEPPIVYNGSVYIPLKRLFESIGFTVQWDNNSKSFTAFGNNQMISNAVNSPFIVVNGRAIISETFSILYKDRVYVPLRMMGNALGGTVSFDAQNKTIYVFADVEVKKISEPNPSTSEIKHVLLQGETWDIADKLKYENNQLYIPLVDLFRKINAPYYSSHTGNRLTAYINYKNVTVEAGKHEIIIDEQRKEMPSAPRIINDTMYVHVRWLEPAIGAYVSLDSNTNTLHIQIIEPNFRLNMLEKFEESIITPTPVPSAQLVGDRRLLVSNHPEVLTRNVVENEYGTLWHDVVETEQDEVKHRVYGWHINQFNKKMQLGITVENLSEAYPIYVTDVQGISKKTERSWYLYDVGLPIAESYIGNFLPDVTKARYKVNGSQIIPLRTFEVNNGELIGFLYEFTVKKEEGMEEQLRYNIRTVFSADNTPLQSIADEPILAESAAKHARGTWGQADIEAVLPEYEAGSYEVSYNISNGSSDHLFTSDTSIDSDIAVGNPGHFGALYTVKIPIINPTDSEQEIRIRIGARGGLSAPAIKTKHGAFLSPLLYNNLEAAHVMDVTLGSGESEVVELTLMHGGGAFLPIAVNLSTVASYYHYR